MEVINPKDPKILNESTQDETDLRQRSTVVPNSCYKEDLNRAGMTVFQTRSQPSYYCSFQIGGLACP